MGLPTVEFQTYERPISKSSENCVSGSLACVAVNLRLCLKQGGEQ